MTRAAAALLGLFPAAAAAADPAPPTVLPGTVVPATPELTGVKPLSCYPSLPTAPTVPPNACETCKPAGLMDRIGSRPVRSVIANWSGGSAQCDTGGCSTGHCDRGGTDWSRLKEWFCWKPSKGSGLPLLQPQPYQAPLVAYFPGCREPKFGTCAPCAAKPNCAGGGCAVPTAAPVMPAVPPVADPAAKPMVLPVKYAPSTKPYTNP